MQQAKLILGLLVGLVGPYTVLHAKIGIQSPSKLIYGSGPVESRFIILKECFLNDLEPSQDCDKKVGVNQAKEGAEDLPAIIALHQQDFIRAALFADASGPKLLAREIARYMTTNGRKNLDADISTFELMLSSEESDKTEIEEIRKELERLQVISERLRRGDTMIEKIAAAEMNLVTPFNVLWKLSETALRNPENGQLIYERNQRLWVRYLGLGDYYDATGTTRMRSIGNNRLTDEGVDQINLGGCKKVYGSEYRLPTTEELKAMRRSIPFSTATKELYKLDIETVRISSSGYVHANAEYIRNYNYNFNNDAHDKLTKSPIICVINAGL